MKIGINFTKKHLYMLMVVFVVFAGLVFVIAVAPNPGHDASEIGEGTIGGALTVSGGKVGVGISNPSVMLDVNGDIKARDVDLSGAINSSGTITSSSSITSSGSMTANNQINANKFGDEGGQINIESPGSSHGWAIDSDGVGRLRIFYQYPPVLAIHQDGRMGVGSEGTDGALNMADSVALTVNGNFYVTGYASVLGLTQRSDARLKEDIVPIECALDKVLNLNGVTFKWKEEAVLDGNQGDSNIGLIAQEVEQTVPEVVETDSDGYKSIAYAKLTALLIEAVKELKAENDALKWAVCEESPEKDFCS